MTVRVSEGSGVRGMDTSEYMVGTASAVSDGNGVTVGTRFTSDTEENLP